ncbi:aminopeptidase N [Streptomyces sp. NPDC059092]|uniref:aminopeptidase N n=1 Tax=Streptomyces sp. NPDC059092 TaxID=3346725 RepID=UPI0036C5E694
MPVLTRDEAQTRARLLDVQRYTIALDLTAGEDTFDSSTVIQFTARAAGDTFVELKPATLRTVTLDGASLDPAALDGNRLALTGLTAGAHELRVDAAMRYSRTGEGMHRFTDPTDGETYVYTQLFMEDVQRVFAAFDQPDLKAVFELTVTAPERWTVLGNGIAERIGTERIGTERIGQGQDGTERRGAGKAGKGQGGVGKAGKGQAGAGHGGTEQGGAARWTLAPTPRISTYLVAVAAGPWHTIRTEHAGLPFGIHCRRSLAPHLDTDADEIFEITRACYDRYHEKFEEPYPFDSYDQAFVPEFNAGAMENPGLVTFRDEFVYRSAVTDNERQTRAMVIAHEMAHMWFGDLVTLTWWDDIWLNESFAEYMGYQTLTEATRFTDTWVDFGIWRKGWGYDADQRPSTHPVAPDPAAVPDTASALLNFDGISYAKGASALRQLVAWLGEKDFLAGINTHFARHKFGNATLADFIDSLAHATDRDVHAWAEQWLRTTGVDTLTPRITDHTTRWTLDVDRDGSRPHRLTVGTYDTAPDDGTGPTRLVPRERFELDLPLTEPLTLPGRRPALVLLNDGDCTYAKIRLDAPSWDTALRTLSGIPEPLTRTVLWNAARDMVRDGELAPTAYLDAARTHLPHETDVALAEGVLAFAATQITDRYLTPEQRPAALATLTALCRDLIRRTEDGNHPGLRLTAVRHFIDAATQPDPLQDWLDSGSVPGGPELDPELRWRVLTRLAVLGAVDTATIDAELDRDPSATGQEGAAHCRAALPDPEAKARAWARLFDATDELSNYLFTATAKGFWQPEQADLVREYVPRFYPEAIALAGRRGPAIADAAGRYAFPAYAVDEASLRLGQDCLDRTEMIPSLRRKLIDQLDDLGRALRVRTG